MDIIKMYVNEKLSIGQFCKKYNLKRKDVVNILRDNGFIIKQGYKYNTIIALKFGIKEYIDNINNKPSLTKLAKKYKVNRNILSERLKQLGIKIVNYQNIVKFNENIFDCIDTEEKAYWLGFIFADGYISSKRYNFELSLSSKDQNHLIKFNKFMGHKLNNIKFGKSILNEKVFYKVKWIVRNKHLWNILNSYGCTPRKSLTLKFPNIKIFKSKDLIRHFIRGYFDGDGCISFSNKDHTKIFCNILGTEQFLNVLQNYIPFNHRALGYNNNDKMSKTRTISFSYKTANNFLNYLYKDSIIFLDRKYNKFLTFCRL